MTEESKIETLERKISRLEENAEQSKKLIGKLGKCLMLLVQTLFVNRRKIRKMYNNNGHDISKTVELYFKEKRKW